MKCAVQIYMVSGGGGVNAYKAVFLGWVVGRFNIAVNGEHNCGVPPIANTTPGAVVAPSCGCPLNTDLE